MNRTQFILLAASFLLIVSGIFFGDLYNGIFIKAVSICLECIGIG